MDNRALLFCLYVSWEELLDLVQLWIKILKRKKNTSGLCCHPCTLWIVGNAVLQREEAVWTQKVKENKLFYSNVGSFSPRRPVKFLFNVNKQKQATERPLSSPNPPIIHKYLRWHHIPTPTGRVPPRTSFWGCSDPTPSVLIPGLWVLIWSSVNDSSLRNFLTL